ncbi:MAG: hypothetical protein PVJ92_00140 [Candidatus Dependentiae bacterium]|jgi:hypothetical protein
MKVIRPLSLALVACSGFLTAASLTTQEAHTTLTTFAERAGEISKTLIDLLRDRKRTENKKRQDQVTVAKKAEQESCDEAIKKITAEHKERKKNLQTACTARKKELTAQAKTDKDELSRRTKQATTALTTARSKAQRRHRTVDSHLTAVTNFLTTIKTQARDAQLPDIVTLTTQEEARLAKESRALAAAA